MAKAPSATPGSEEPDPSMDDILASIRRILNEDEKTKEPSAPGVLMLDPSMIVEEGTRREPGAAPGDALPPVHAAPAHDTLSPPAAEEPRALAMMDDPMQGGSVLSDLPSPSVPHTPPQPDSPLVAPAAAAAAAHSVGSLVRTLAAERSAAVTRGGLTIEDLVREEVRPVLKAWLDTHLPPLVERMVRAELERVVGRTV